LASGSSDTGPVFGLLSGCIYVSIILYRAGTDEAQGSGREENQEKKGKRQTNRQDAASELVLC
jgi:hypothetical protein